jgi:hypothetical protein
MRRLSLAAALMLTCSACAFSPGVGFASVKGGTVVAHWGLPNSGGSSWKTGDGYILTFDDPKPKLTLNAVELQTLDATPAPGTDSAQTGVNSVPLTAVTLTAPSNAFVSVGPPAGEGIPLPLCSPTCDLPRGVVAAIKVTFERLQASGTVVASQGQTSVASGPLSWRIDLPLQGLSFVTPTQVASDRLQPQLLQLSGRLDVSPQLFDGIDWARVATLASPGDLATDAKSRAMVYANLTKSAWVADLTRMSP